MLPGGIISQFNLLTFHTSSDTTPSTSYYFIAFISLTGTLLQRRCHYPLVLLLILPFFLNLLYHPLAPSTLVRLSVQGIYIAKPNTFVLGPACHGR